MSPMKSILWKEVRQQGSWFLLMLLVALVTLAGVFFALGGFGYQPWNVARETLNLVAIIGFGLSAVLALALSSNAFASEKEKRTHQNLFLIPASLRQLVMGKVLVASGFVVGYLVFMVAGLLLLSLFNNFRTGQGENLFLPAWIRQAPLWSAEFFIWGLFFSLMVSRPIVAAILAGIAAPLAGLLLSSTEWPYDFSPLKASWMPDDEVWLNDQLAVSSVWLRGAVAFLIALASAWLARLWLPSNGRTGRPDFSLVSDEIATGREWESRRLPFLRKVTGFGAGYGRFIWLGLRSCWPYLLLWSILAIAVIIGAISSRNLWMLFATLPILGGLAGTLAFTPDRSQEGQAFLGVRAEKPAAFWLSRTLIWAFWLALVMTLVALFIFREYPLRGMGSSPLHTQPEDDYRFGRTDWSGFSLVYGGGLGNSFCAGLFCSILMGSRILAAGAAIAVSIPLIAWYLLMLAGDVPLWLSVIPVIVALLAGSLVGTHLWFARRLERKQLFGLAAALLAVLAATGWATIQYRANEIPECGIPLAAIPVQHDQLPDFDRLEQVISRLEAIRDRAPEIDYDIAWRNADFLNDQEGFETRQFGLDLVDDVVLLELLKGKTIKRGTKNVVPSASAFGAAYRLRRIPGGNQNRESLDALAQDFDFSSVLDVEGLIAQVDNTLESNSKWLDEFGRELENTQDSFDEIERAIAYLGQFPDSQKADSLVGRLYKLCLVNWGSSNSALSHLLWQNYLRSLRDRNHDETWAALRMYLLWKSIGGLDRYRHLYGSLGHEFTLDLWLNLAHPNPDQIKESIRFLEGYIKPEKYDSTEWVAEYLAWERMLNRAQWSNRSELVDRFSNTLISLVPSERERAIRLNDWFFASAVSAPLRVAALEFPDAAEYYHLHLANLRSRFDPSRIASLGRATLRPQSIPDYEKMSKGGRLEDCYESKAVMHFGARANAELAQIYLAICGWQKKYESLPESLESLAPEFLDRVPTLDFSVYRKGGQVEPKWILERIPVSEATDVGDQVRGAGEILVVQLNNRHPYARKLDRYSWGSTLRLEFVLD